MDGMLFLDSSGRKVFYRNHVLPHDLKGHFATLIVTEMCEGWNVGELTIYAYESDSLRRMATELNKLADSLDVAVCDAEARLEEAQRDADEKKSLVFVDGLLQESAAIERPYSDARELDVIDNTASVEEIAARR